MHIIPSIDYTSHTAYLIFISIFSPELYQHFRIKQRQIALHRIGIVVVFDYIN